MKETCKSNGKWYSFSPYETKCTVCGKYYTEDTTPECRGFNESKVQITNAQWKLLDPGNPAFMPADRSKWIEWQRADYKIGKQESSGAYWTRVGKEITEKRLNASQSQNKPRE